MTFSEAMENVYAGYKVRIASWPEGVFLRLFDGGIFYEGLENNLEFAINLQMVRSTDWEVVQ